MPVRMKTDLVKAGLKISVRSDAIESRRRWYTPVFCHIEWGRGRNLSSQVDFFAFFLSDNDALPTYQGDTYKGDAYQRIRGTGNLIRFEPSYDHRGRFSMIVFFREKHLRRLREANIIPEKSTSLSHVTSIWNSFIIMYVLDSQCQLKKPIFKRYNFLFPDNGFFVVALLDFLTTTKRSRGNTV